MSLLESSYVQVSRLNFVPSSPCGEFESCLIAGGNLSDPCRVHGTEFWHLEDLLVQNISGSSLAWVHKRQCNRADNLQCNDILIWWFDLNTVIAIACSCHFSSRSLDHTVPRGSMSLSWYFKDFQGVFGCVVHCSAREVIASVWKVQLLQVLTCKEGTVLCLIMELLDMLVMWRIAGPWCCFFYQTCLFLGQTLQFVNVFPILPRFCSGGDLRTLIRNQRDEESARNAPSWQFVKCEM